ncbi:MAG: tandem-95 repeat protein, partial [Opitutae bacterium]|nr:tandem-95 repeat protein [Opitutae bacterium]
NVTVAGTGNSPSSLLYVPDGNFSGSDSFVLKVFDSGDINASDSIVITVNVLSLEDDPVFRTLTSGVAVKDNLFDYSIKVVDEDLDSNITISSLVPLPSWVTLRDDGNGSARLWGTPNQYDLASNLIVLEGRDETNRFAIQAFMLVVLEQNTNPVITQGEVLSITHTEDTTWQGRSLVSASDVDGQFLTWSLKEQAPNGVAQVSGQGASPPVLEYLPDSNYSGMDSFQVEVSDGIGSDLITINLNIQNVDDAPVFSILPTDQVTIDNQNFVISLKVHDADSLIGSDVQLTGPSWLGVSSFDRSSGVVLLEGVPKESDEGNSSFSLRITDSTGLHNSAEFKVQVRVLNYAPLINSGSASVSVTMIEDDNTSWSAPNLVGADYETSANDLVWSFFTEPNFGSVSVSGTGSSPVTFDYSPDGNFSGSDSFIVKVTDGGGIEGSPPKYDTILVNVEVSPVNDPPVFTSIPIYSWNDESVYVYEIKTHDADWNYSWHSIDLNISGDLPEWLNFKDEGNGTGILYGLAAVKDKGNHTIAFEVFDSNQTSSVQAFDLEIRIDNYPPVFKSVSEANKTISELVVYVDEDSNLSSLRGAWVAPTDYLAVDPDPGNPDAKTLSWTLFGIPSSGSNVVVEGSGERPGVFSYTPSLNYFGEDIIQLKVNDGHRDSILPVRVQVRGLPDIPVFSTSFDSVLVAKEGAQFNSEIKTYDPDYSPRTIKVFGLPSGGNSWLQLVDQNSTTGTARLFGVPPSQASGERYQLAFVVTDDTGRFSVANTQLIVDGKNSSPVINLGASAVVRFDRSGNAKPSDLSKLYATDLEGGILEWSLSPNSLPSFGTVRVSGNGIQTPLITYLPYSIIKEDKFKIRVSDGTSYDEIEITAVVVESFDSFEVSDPTISSIPSGRLLVEHFKISNLVSNSLIDALLLDSPAWMKIEKVEFDLFKLHGIVPYNLVGDVGVKVLFFENGKNMSTKEYTLKVTDSTPPDLSLKGDEFMRLRLGDNYVEPGYLSVDQDGQDLTSTVQVNGNVNSNQIGLNLITYQSTDSTGNSSQLKRTIQVVDGNNTVQKSTLNSQVSMDFDDFVILDKGVVVLEFMTGGESRVARYSDYTDFSNPINSMKFNADYVRLEKMMLLEDKSILLCGVFRGNLSFGENLVRSKGSYNLFVLKLDSNFKRIWLKALSCSSTLENLELMETMDQSIQIGGNFHQQLQLGSQTWNTQGASDNFIWNLNSVGEFGWLKTFGGIGVEEMVGLSGLADGSFLSVSNTQKESDPMYSTLIKFSQNGEVLSGKSFITGFHNKAIGVKFEKDSIFLSGEFKTKLVVDNKTVLSNSTQSGFMCSLNLDFVPNWVVAFSSSGETKAEEIQIDPFGYPLCILSFDGNISLPQNSHVYSSLGSDDLMVIKLNPSNGAILWEESIGSTGPDTPIAFDVDSFGTILVGADLTVPFSLNGTLVSEGNEFLLKLESVQGRPSFQSVLDLVLLENEFFNQEINVLNQSVVRMEMVSGAEWINFQDNKDGTAMLGGLVPSFSNQSGS